MNILNIVRRPYEAGRSLPDVARDLNETGFGIALYFDNRSLVCVVTDGDLRRAIINEKLNIDEFANFKPSMVANDKSIGSFKKNKVWQRHRITTDQNGEINGVFLQDSDENRFHEIPALIMAGGEGKRLGGLVSRTPKPMLEIDGKPLLLNN